MVINKTDTTEANTALTNSIVIPLATVVPTKLLDEPHRIGEQAASHEHRVPSDGDIELSLILETVDLGYTCLTPQWKYETLHMRWKQIEKKTMSAPLSLLGRLRVNILQIYGTHSRCFPAMEEKLKAQKPKVQYLHYNHCHLEQLPISYYNNWAENEDSHRGLLIHECEQKGHFWEAAREMAEPWAGAIHFRGLHITIPVAEIENIRSLLNQSCRIGSLEYLAIGLQARRRWRSKYYDKMPPANIPSSITSLERDCQRGCSRLLKETMEIFQDWAKSTDAYKARSLNILLTTPQNVVKAKDEFVHMVFLKRAEANSNNEYQNWNYIMQSMVVSEVREERMGQTVSIQLPTPQGRHCFVHCYNQP